MQFLFLIGGPYYSPRIEVTSELLLSVYASWIRKLEICYLFILNILLSSSTQVLCHLA
jgi:hypothetical protein